MNCMSDNTAPTPRASQLKDSRKSIGRFLRPALLLALLLVLVSATRNPAQRGGGGGGLGGGALGGNGGFGDPNNPSLDQDTLNQGRNMTTDREDPIRQERRLKAANADRQKSMVEDTNRLLKLTTELNAEVNGGHSQVLNADQLRKVAEIEKLAHNVREKMTTSVGAQSPIMQPVPYQFPNMRY
jgi:hypothetical protein